MLSLDFERKGPWYMGVEFEDSHLVTDKNHNQNLGISSIILREPKSKESEVLASVLIRFTNRLEVEGAIYPAKNGSEMNFNTQQKKLFRQDGSEYYIPVDVRVPMAISAQVLRHAETKRKEEAVIPANTQLVDTLKQQLSPEQLAVYAQIMSK